MKVFDKTWKLAVAGALVGVLAALLAYFGNPANMAICIACFVRDTAGALKLHSAAPVQYFRPEIVGFAVGAFAISLVTNEYKATAGSSPMIRFVLGAIMVIGALVFLGCPLRMVLRMAAGDLNAYVALVGFAGGIATGSFFLKKGFSLGRAYETQKSSGYVLPVDLERWFVLSEKGFSLGKDERMCFRFFTDDPLCSGCDHGKRRAGILRVTAASDSAYGSR